MSRQFLIAIALGGSLVAAAPFAVHAQSGDALAHAERACLDSRVQPRTTSFDVCVSRAAMAFERGQPTVAYDEARRVARTRDVCLSYGINPRSLGYQQCVNNELDRQSVHNISHVDTYGFRYDRDGRLYDPDGYQVRPNPKAVTW